MSKLGATIIEAQENGISATDPDFWEKVQAL
jgi:hypothetical protein